MEICPFPLKIAPSQGEVDPIYPSPQPNGIVIGSVVFAGLTIVTDRLTDRPRYSIYNNRPHLRM